MDENPLGRIVELKSLKFGIAVRKASPFGIMGATRWLPRTPSVRTRDRWFVGKPPSGNMNNLSFIHCFHCLLQIVISAPSADAPMFVMGVNQENYTSDIKVRPHLQISCAQLFKEVCASACAVCTIGLVPLFSVSLKFMVERP